jgi:prepilin-type N-terminal cleavage/methylation domain-containing protein
MKRGFTLIEVLIVISVIAIMIAIAVPAFRGIQMDAKQSRAGADLKVLRVAIDSFLKNQNDFPDSSFGIGSFPNWQNSLLDTAPRVLEQKLFDPFRNGQVEFQYAVNGTYFIVWSVGPNQRSTITGINEDGEVLGTIGDDIYQTNGQRI